MHFFKIIIKVYWKIILSSSFPNIFVLSENCNYDDKDGFLIYYLALGFKSYRETFTASLIAAITMYRYKLMIKSQRKSPIND